MLRRIILAVVVGVIVTLGCVLLGMLLGSLKIDWVIAIGDFLGSYAGVLGILAALWHFFSGGYGIK